eukprot:6103030-Pleurochrysis_carterae.AAC.1
MEQERNNVGCLREEGRCEKEIEVWSASARARYKPRGCRSLFIVTSAERGGKKEWRERTGEGDGAEDAAKGETGRLKEAEAKQAHWRCKDWCCGGKAGDPRMSALVSHLWADEDRVVAHKEPRRELDVYVTKCSKIGNHALGRCEARNALRVVKQAIRRGGAGFESLLRTSRNETQTKPHNS